MSYNQYNAGVSVIFFVKSRLNMLELRNMRNGVLMQIDNMRCIFVKWTLPLV